MSHCYFSDICVSFHISWWFFFRISVNTCSIPRKVPLVDFCGFSMSNKYFLLEYDMKWCEKGGFCNKHHEAFEISTKTGKFVSGGWCSLLQVFADGFWCLKRIGCGLYHVWKVFWAPFCVTLAICFFGQVRLSLLTVHRSYLLNLDPLILLQFFAWRRAV